MKYFSIDRSGGENASLCYIGYRLASVAVISPFSETNKVLIFCACEFDISIFWVAELKTVV